MPSFKKSKHGNKAEIRITEAKWNGKSYNYPTIKYNARSPSKSPRKKQKSNPPHEDECLNFEDDLLLDSVNIGNPRQTKVMSSPKPWSNCVSCKKCRAKSMIRRSAIT